MGTYDSVYFGIGNTVCDAVPEEYRAEEWQTKDLYDAMYCIVIQNDKTYYKDRSGVLVHLPLNQSLEIHNWDDDKNLFTQLQVDVASGVVTKVGPFVNRVFGVPPHLSEMSADDEAQAKNIEKNLARLNKTWSDRPLLFKVKSNARACKREWSTAWYHFVSGIKRLFGVY
jgi:hypothetical protein